MHKNSSFGKLLLGMAAAAFFCAAPLNAAGTEPFDQFVLQNGMCVFVMEDYSSALVSMELTVRSGWQEQTAQNWGYQTLYTRLFRDAVAASTTAQVTVARQDMGDTYAVTTTPALMEQAVSALSRTALMPQFSDQSIQSAYQALQAEQAAYEQTTTALINTAIDSRVYSAAPWKVNAGHNPRLERPCDTAAVRAQLDALHDSLYTPDNAALFVTGPVSAGDVRALAQKWFGMWYGSRAAAPAEQGLEPLGTRKFVIVDDSFSPGLSQIAVLFTTLGAEQADVLGAAFSMTGSRLMQALVANPLLAIRSQDYAAASSARLSGNPRLIVQALLEAPYSLATDSDGAQTAPVAEQADAFVATIQDGARLTRTELIAAQNAVQSQYKSRMGTPALSMQVLSDFWAQRPSFSRDGFYADFVAMQTASFTLNQEALAQAASREEPFVFLMVSPQTYREQQAAFDAGGWELVTRQNASWTTWPHAQAVLGDAQTKTERAQEAAAQYFADDTLNAAQLFYAANAPLFYSGQLQNGIPITIKRTPRSQTVVFSLAIQGGELSSPQGEQFLRTTLVNAFATNIQAEVSALRAQNAFYGEPEILAWTEETVSYITVQCQKEDLGAVLTAASNAVIFGDISPVTADNLVYEQRGQWQSKTQSVQFQIQTEGLRRVFAGSSFERLFGTQAQVLSQTAFGTVSLAYTRLLDAALYSVVITGDVTEQDALEAAERTFGTLREQTVRQAPPAIPGASLTSGTGSIKLNHTFTTTMSADLASKDSPLLVPTTEFSDPVASFFCAPDDPAERAAFNALMAELASRVQQKLPEGTTCTYTEADAQVKVGILQADALLHTARFDTAYRDARLELLLALSDGDQSLVQQIALRHALSVLSGTQTNGGTARLIQEGIICGNPMQYVTDYLFVQGLTAQDLLFFAEHCLPEEPLTFYSADSKK